MRRAEMSVVLGLWGGIVTGCAASPSTPADPAANNDQNTGDQKTDAELVFAQEAGELPPPQGVCPERTEPDVLKNPRAAVTRTAFGLAYCLLHDAPGGVVPAATDTVKVHYSGWTPEGRLFDSSVERGQPAEFALNQVIRGWTEALQLMTPGDKARVWIPGDMAYGNQEPGTADQNPPKGTLIFEIEFLEVVSK